MNSNCSVVIERGEAVSVNKIKPFTMNKQWYVLYTKSNCEKKVNELLCKKGIEAYCPLNKIYRQWSDRRKQLNVPLFPSYVFVKVTEKDLLSLRNMTSKIVSILYWLGKPAVIKNEEISEIKYFLNQHADVKLEKRIVDINDEVVVIRGPFYNQKGIVKSLKNNAVVLSLPSLGYNMVAELDLSNIKQVYTFNHEMDFQKHTGLSLC